MIDSRFFREDCFIGGRWVGGDARLEVTNPATGKTVGTVPKFRRAETRAAIDAADSAFADWRRRPAAERADYCRKIYQALMDHQEELGRLLTIEMGKPLAEAKGEVAYAANFFKWFGEEARRVYGDVVPLRGRTSASLSPRSRSGLSARSHPGTFRPP